MRSRAFLPQIFVLMALPAAEGRLLTVCAQDSPSAADQTASPSQPHGETAAVSIDDGIDRINAALQSSWAAAGIKPAPDCNDEVFVRRLYLDLAGRVPTIAEREAFLDDSRADKRSRLVDLLLSSEDHVQHFADMLDALLMGRGGPRRTAERVEHQWRSWLESVIRDNRPWNHVVEAILLARPATQDERGAVWFLYERKDDYQKIAEAVAPAFFGIRIDCAQCHNHMVATEIEQAHYWGLVAFFNRGKNIDTPNGPRVGESAIGGFSEFANLEGSSSPNLLTFFESPVIDESRPAADAKQEDSDDLYQPASLDGDPRVPKFSRRERFVRDVVVTHPLVARAFVNRMWAMLLGRGIVHPYDQMDSVHPPSHPELLDWLAQDFRESGFDVRRLVRMLVLSRPYQLSSVRPEGLEDPATFAWAIERPLTAEQLARSLQLVLRGGFRNDDPLVSAVRESLPAVMPEQSLTTIGDALFLTNNAVMNQFITDSSAEGQLIPRAAALASDEERIRLLFNTVFCREASSEEADAVRQVLNGATDQDLVHRLRQVLWAMVTSAEFRFNH